MHAKWGDKTTGTINGHAAFLDRFRREAVELADGQTLTEEEIERRADHLLAAHMKKLALVSAQRRAERKAAR